MPQVVCLHQPNASRVQERAVLVKFASERTNVRRDEAPPGGLRSTWSSAKATTPCDRGVDCGRSGCR